MAGGLMLAQSRAATPYVAGGPERTTTPAPPAGGPFLRFTHGARKQGFKQSGVGFGDLVNPPLKSANGWWRYLDLRITASGGDAGLAVVAGAADAPANIIKLLTLQDAFNNTVIKCNGWNLVNMIDLFSAQHGFWNAASVAALPSFSAMDADGNFEFRARIPFELFDSYCSIPGANQQAIPQIEITMNDSAAVYDTPPDDLPTIQVAVQVAYYAANAEHPEIAPPGEGSTHRWSEQTVPTEVTSGSDMELALPPLAGYVTGLFLIGRDANNVRTDEWLPDDNNRIEFVVDDDIWFSEEVGTRKDLMFQQYGVTRPTGVIGWTFRDSVQSFGPVSSLDTGDMYVLANIGSLFTIRSSTWGTIVNGPVKLTLVAGRLYPKDGIPYGHLAD